MTSSFRDPQGTKPSEVVQHKSIPVIELTCVADARRLERELRHRPGVLEAVVNPVTDRAYITFDAGRVTEDELCQLILQLGFDAECRAS